MNAFAWANDVKDKLEKEFADRLVFVGLQGSRARANLQKIDFRKIATPAQNLKLNR